MGGAHTVAPPPPPNPRPLCIGVGLSYLAHCVSEWALGLCKAHGPCLAQVHRWTSVVCMAFPPPPALNKSHGCLMWQVYDVVWPANPGKKGVQGGGGRDRPDREITGTAPLPTDGGGVKERQGEVAGGQWVPPPPQTDSVGVMPNTPPPFCTSAPDVVLPPLFGPPPLFVSVCLFEPT